MNFRNFSMVTFVALVFATSAVFAASHIKIGASLPLTGGFSLTGDKHKQGYQLCIDLINNNGGILGRKVDLLVSDNRSDTETALNQYERMINVQKVDLIFGTFLAS